MTGSRVRRAGPLVLALAGTAAVAWVAAATAGREVVHDDPRARTPARREGLDHAPFFDAPFTDPRDVTRACLVCHEGAAREVMGTTHWTWGGHGRVGKRTAINNFCISIAANWPRCTSCHAGYGWTDDGFLERAGEQDVDCLVCHDRSGSYAKDPQGAGLPTKDTDLLAAARSVGRPTRAQCGACHFAGGGGDAVKHGDLDGTMVHPTPRIDVHMGRHGLECVDCHRTSAHQVAGRILPATEDAPTRVACTDCHAARPHGQARLDAHVDAVACQTCHVPSMAVEAPTKMSWDWSQAGRDLDEGHLYSKAKGRFEYARQVPPTIAWYDGTTTRYAPGDRIDDLEGLVTITRPNGSIADARARLWPFKVHTGRQPADAEHRWLLTPKTFGPGGYWTTFDWPQALRLGADASGLAYSGEHVFVRTEMWWPIHHMVQEAGRALQCADCHGESGRVDWSALGYPGDPARHGGRRALGLVKEESGVVTAQERRHPEVVVLDGDGAPVTSSGRPASPIRTCDGCHDAPWIAASAHHDLGQGAEHDCFVCHVQGADAAARARELEAGRPEWAATATLSKVRGPLQVGRPTTTHCVACHDETDTTGQRFSGQLVADSDLRARRGALVRGLPRGRHVLARAVAPLCG